MIAHHCDSNAILAVLFKTWADRHQMIAYNTIMQRLKDRKLIVDLQILDNEASKAYKQTITSDWGIKFQLVPPHIHRQTRYSNIQSPLPGYFSRSCRRLPKTLLGPTIAPSQAHIEPSTSITGTTNDISLQMHTGAL